MAQPQIDPRTPHVKATEMVKVKDKKTGHVMLVNAIDRGHAQELVKPRHERDPFIMSTLPQEPHFDPTRHEIVDDDVLAQGEPDPDLKVPANPLVGQPRAKKEEEDAEEPKAKKGRTRLKKKDEDDEDDED